MSESRTDNVVKNSGAALLYKGIHLILQFVLRTTFIRLLGNEYTGISTLFTDILQVLSLMDLGVGAAMLYALYKPLAENDGKRISALMFFYKKAYTTIGICVLIAGFACTPFLHYIIKDVPNIKEDIRLIFMMYVLNSSCSYFLVYKTSLLNASQQSRIISLVNTVVQIGEIIIEVILLLLFRAYFLYLIVHFLATLSQNIILSRITQRKFSQYLNDGSARLTRSEVKALFKDIFALGIYKVSGVMIYSTDSIVISAFVGTIQVSILGNFQLITNSVRMMIEQVINAVKPSVGNFVAVANKEKQEDVFNMLNFLCFWMACFCCTCFFVLLNPFVGDIWFDSSFKVEQNIIIVMVINFFIAVMVYPVETFRTANGLFVQGKYRPALMAILNIVLDIIFVQKWGVFGVYVATTISRLLTQCWFDPYLVFTKVYRKMPWKYYLQYLFYALITAGSCVLANMIAQMQSIESAYGTFIYKMIVAAMIPNIIIILLYHRTAVFHSVLDRVKGRLLK